MRITLFFTLLAFFSFYSVNAQTKGYYRSPCLYQNTVVFTAEGDLWKYDLVSGVTSRITTHAGLEINAAISPDGKKIAFTGEYEGIPEIYEIDMEGGVPRRLTFDYDGRYMHLSGWTKDGKILYRTGRYSGLINAQLVKLDPVSGVVEPVPLWQASEGCYDDAGNLYFTRFPNQGSKTKRYKGGLIEQVWKFDGQHEAVCLTGNFDGTSTRPMFFNGRIYFLSDRDGTMNIWSMDKDGKDLMQKTFSKGWDIQTPSISGGRIVYQKGADLCLYDIQSNAEKMLDIHLLSDFDQRKPRWIKSPVSSISFWDLSPNGNYAAIISRGRLFVSPAKSDRWVEVSRRSGIRFKEVHFINDKSLAVLSDESGEFEIWRMSADGSDSAKQLTKNTKTQIRSFAVSPNGKYIGFDDKNDVVRIAEAATGAIKFEYSEAYAGTGELAWSPNSRFLNFNRGLENLNDQVCLVDVQTMKMTPITTTRLNSSNPAWTSDGKWLYFTSERNLHTLVGAPWGARQPEPYYTATSNIYAIPLDSSLNFPFLPTDSWLSDSVFNPSVKETTSAEKTKNKKEQDKKEKAETAALAEKSIDWEKATTRLYQVPVKSANLSAMDVADGFLYWIDRGSVGGKEGPKLFALKIQESKTYEPTEVASNVAGFNLSTNKKKILIYFNNRVISIADANGQKVDVDKTKLELENWSFVVNPVQDWNEMFADAWRMMRDYFYDRDMHKVDWVAIREHYEPLVSRITDRYELDDLLAQMVGELSALHTFVGGGDKRRSPDLIQAGFLGALLQRNARGLTIEHIYRSDPDYPESASPLNRPELRIKEGDIITGVNNTSLSEVRDISELLDNKVDEPVKLSLIDQSGKHYDQVVKPISASDNDELRYGEWELTRREKTDSLSHDEIGYIHLKAMSSFDMDDFVKQFYPVFTRKGLILDVRQNHGGNIDSWVLEKLLRKAWMYWQGRSGGPIWNMNEAFRGHMVILCDQGTASDGEAVTEGFRRLGLGKVIGMRTWGGEIWLSADNRLVDNGIASAAELGVYGPEGKWLIEGRGVEPDFVVDNLPFASYLGKDAQLEFAINYLQKLIAAEPVEVPQAPPHPDKSFKY